MSTSAPDLLARVPADLLRQLRAHGPQPKTFRAGDIVMPDPAMPRPRGKHKLADYVLAPEQSTVQCGPFAEVKLLGYEVLPGGKLADKVSVISWCVLVIGQYRGLAQDLPAPSTVPSQLAAQPARRAVGRPANRPPIQGERGWSWWHRMRADYPTDRPIEVGDIVQSIAGKHLRRLWKVVQLDDGQGRLVGRRVSWKTGEVQPGRAHPITVEVVRLVPRTETHNAE